MVEINLISWVGSGNRCKVYITHFISPPKMSRLQIMNLCTSHNIRITNNSLYFVKILWGVLVCHVWGRNVKLEVRSEVLKVVIVGQFICNVNVQSNGCFISPASENIKESLRRNSTFLYDTMSPNYKS